MVGDKYPWRTRPCQGLGYISSPSAISVAERRPSSKIGSSTKHLCKSALASPAANPPVLRRINAIAAAETTCLIFEPWLVRHIHVARQLSATSHELFWSVE